MFKRKVLIVALLAVGLLGSSMDGQATVAFRHKIKPRAVETSSDAVALKRRVRPRAMETGSAVARSRRIKPHAMVTGSDTIALRRRVKPRAAVDPANQQVNLTDRLGRHRVKKG